MVTGIVIVAIVIYAVGWFSGYFVATNEDKH